MLQPRLIRVHDDKSFSCHLTGPEMSRYLTNTLLFNTKLKRTSLVFLIAWGWESDGHGGSHGFLGEQRRDQFSLTDYKGGM